MVHWIVSNFFILIKKNLLNWDVKLLLVVYRVSFKSIPDEVIIRLLQFRLLLNKVVQYNHLLLLRNGYIRLDSFVTPILYISAFSRGFLALFRLIARNTM